MAVLGCRQGEAVEIAEGIPVTLGDGCSFADPLLKPWQLHVQDSRLDRIQPAVVAKAGVQIALGHAVHGELTHGLGQLGIAGGDGTAVSRRTEVLGGEEAEAARIAEAAHRLALPASSRRLGAVFDHLQLMAFGNGHQSGHVHCAPEQVHRHQGPGGGGDRSFDLIEIDQVGAGVDIHEHRRGADGADGLSRGEKTERAGDHFIAGANAQATQGQDQSVGAAVAAHGVLAANTGGKRFLEAFDLRSTDVLTAAQHFEHRLFEVHTKIVDLLAEAEGRYLHKAKLKWLSRTTPAPVRGSTSHCSPPRRSGLDSPKIPSARPRGRPAGHDHRGADRCRVGFRPIGRDSAGSAGPRHQVKTGRTPACRRP